MSEPIDYAKVTKPPRRQGCLVVILLIVLTPFWAFIVSQFYLSARAGSTPPSKVEITMLILCMGLPLIFAFVYVLVGLATAFRRP